MKGPVFDEPSGGRSFGRAKSAEMSNLGEPAHRSRSREDMNSGGPRGFRGSGAKGPWGVAGQRGRMMPPAKGPAGDRAKPMGPNSRSKGPNARSKGKNIEKDSANDGPRQKKRPHFNRSKKKNDSRNKSDSDRDKDDS